MRRTLALCAAAAALRAAPAAAEPMDLDLARLGAPAASVWNTLATRAGTPPISASDASRLAFESTQRYRQLVLQLAMGLTSFTLDEAATGGMAGFQASLEFASTAIRHPLDGTALPAPVGPPLSVWPVHGTDPSRLGVEAFHVTKSLPYSFQVGGRLIYVNQSQMAAGQLELKWAIQENYLPLWLPDIALRTAYTRLYGQRDLELNVVDLDAVVSKRFGVAGSFRLTPYGILRLSWVGAKTTPIDFGPTSAACPPATPTCFPDQRDPATALATTVPFPDMKFGENRIFRWAVGGRFDAAPLVMAVEISYQSGKHMGQVRDLSEIELPDAIAYSFRAGFDF